MSGSMTVGRVLLPGLGLALSGVLAWQAWRGGIAASHVPFAFTLVGGSEGLQQASPSKAPQREEARQPESPAVILAEGHVAACPAPRSSSALSCPARLRGSWSRRNPQSERETC